MFGSAVRPVFAPLRRGRADLVGTRRRNRDSIAAVSSPTDRRVRPGVPPAPATIGGSIGPERDSRSRVLTDAARETLARARQAETMA